MHDSLQKDRLPSTGFDPAGWLSYGDRDDPFYHPVSDEQVQAHRFWKAHRGDVFSPDWVSQEWLTRSALVSIDNAEKAAISTDPYSIAFSGPSWSTPRSFEDGLRVSAAEIVLHPIVFCRRHPISRSIIAELTPDFVLYHALDRTGSIYNHPLEPGRVAELLVDPGNRGDPSLLTELILSADYLRDYLAMRSLALIVCQVADRYVNTGAPFVCNLADERTPIGPNTWKTTQAAEDTTGKTSIFRARSTLWRNIIVYPYERPRVSRSPWPRYFQPDDPDPHDMPKFILDGQGTKAALSRYGSPTQYLFFRPEVLQRYLGTSGYSVFFHMRNWGFASNPSRQTVDVGFNSHGILNAYAPDIADLVESEQAYWASHSCLPSGEICEDMVQTRMQQNPPHSPSVAELLERGVRNLDEAFRLAFGTNVSPCNEIEGWNRSAVTVGPLSADLVDVSRLAKVVCGCLIERLNVNSLRAVLGNSHEADWKQIRLLEEVLVQRCSLDRDRARAVTAPLRGLNGLRIADAHVLTPALGKAFKELGMSDAPATAREGWAMCVDAVAHSLNEIANFVRP